MYRTWTSASPRSVQFNSRDRSVASSCRGRSLLKVKISKEPGRESLTRLPCGSYMPSEREKVPGASVVLSESLEHAKNELSGDFLEDPFATRPVFTRNAL